MFAISLASYGKSVDESTAQKVAYNFLKPKTNLQGLSDLSLVYTSNSVLNGNNIIYFYIYNSTSTQGFVIVSGDDIVMPVLGYSTESAFKANKINTSLQYVLDNYKNQILYAIQNNENATSQVTSKWTDLYTASSSTRAARTTTLPVAPMLPTLWDQMNEFSSVLTYNADCPYDAAAATPAQTITGCVATAMSQVMKYWNWPDTGVGNNTYTQSPNPDGIPEQTADFTIAYHFDSMQVPYTNRANKYVAKLMYFAGVSVNMNYGTPDEDGSGAYVTAASAYGGASAETALQNNWRYPSSVGYSRRHFTQTQWIDSMINEMSSARPVIYGGQGSQGGHCWVMDGFDNDSFFHFNWGWSGNSDGYFTVNNLTPNGDTFNNSQEAIIRIVADTPANYSSDTSTKVKVTGVTTVAAPENNINIFPNPATNSINVSFQGIPAKELMITDIEGRTVQQMTVASTASSLTLSVNDLPNGMYLLRLQTDQGMLTRKFVVAK